MTRATLLALADRVEALTGPCRETDAEICRAIGWRNRDGFWWEPAEVEIARKKRQSIYGFPSYGKSIPGYTASLDAALTLVPEGWRWYEYLWPRKCDPKRVSLVTDIPHGNIAHGKASTIPLALTAAALRARAMMENSDD